MNTPFLKLVYYKHITIIIQTIYQVVVPFSHKLYIDRKTLPYAIRKRQIKYLYSKHKNKKAWYFSEAIQDRELSSLIN